MLCACRRLDTKLVWQVWKTWGCRHVALQLAEQSVDFVRTKRCHNSPFAAIHVFCVDVHFVGASHKNGLERLGVSQALHSCVHEAAVQCLNHTASLKSNFLNDAYKVDVNPENVIGGKGAVVTAFDSSKVYRLLS